MGYACPVCSDPQADAGHLANHLAFTAILGDDAHEDWLDEHAPGWGEMNESELADVVDGDVESTEFPQVFEDTTDRAADPTDPIEERSGMLFADEAGHDHEQAPASADAPMDEETAEILAEAREMTREMLADDDDAES